MNEHIIKIMEHMFWLGVSYGYNRGLKAALDKFESDKPWPDTDDISAEGWREVLLALLKEAV